ncbi:MAG: trans-2-enoyl-CoA reductase family protein [Opitutaceae bacterium]|nr:trans-2-enoyl-CoA reductase family protein [Opitutaceae bacterium]
MIIKPKIRGFVCITSHPEGCAAHVQEQIDHVKSKGLIDGAKKVLIIGASQGYGLATRITAAFGSKASTIGVFFEREPNNGRTATSGFYNTIAFNKKAKEEGLYTANFNGDAFSDEIKQAVIAKIKEDLGQVDLIIYSLGSPRRVHPDTGAVHKSVIKPIGQSFTGKTVDTDKDIISEITIEAASDEEIADTVAVMGGEDWERWIKTLDDAGVIADGATSVAYDYIGPEVTWPIYTNGTIGSAKQDLRTTAKRIDALLKVTRGSAFISVNKALVTQSSSAIPVVPLYISILYKVMKENGTHEGCIEQIDRLFRTQLANGVAQDFDDDGRVRIDNLEMKPEVQAAVAAIWPDISTETLYEKSDMAGYKKEFLRLFGFGMKGVDYEADVNEALSLEE